MKSQLLTFIWPCLSLAQNDVLAEIRSQKQRRQLKCDAVISTASREKSRLLKTQRFRRGSGIRVLVVRHPFTRHAHKYLETAATRRWRRRGCVFYRRVGFPKGGARFVKPRQRLIIQPFSAHCSRSCGGGHAHTLVYNTWYVP